MLKIFKRKRYSLTLQENDPRNYLTVAADPVVIPHPILGKILILVPAPAPDYIDDSWFMYSEQILAHDIETSGMIPVAFYRREKGRFAKA